MTGSARSASSGSTLNLRSAVHHQKVAAENFQIVLDQVRPELIKVRY